MNYPYLHLFDRLGFAYAMGVGRLDRLKYDYTPDLKL
jgi:hypothetical protein